VAVGLLFWLNLMSKVVLLSAAWSANDVDLSRLDGDAPQSAATPAEATAPVASTRPHRPDRPAQGAGTPTRATDRVSVVAGVVVGVATALGAKGIRGMLRR
ncbi:MAG: hypothetical protein HOQ13_04385, partial [Dermatophilaceae bacterium]|nr:hypothetical protein [Dermatophilaceae bacterium]